MDKLVKYSNIDFIKEYSPLNCLRKLKDIKTPVQAAKSEIISIARIKKEKSEDYVLLYIQMWLINLNDYLNLSRKMTPYQMEEISIMILDDYYYYKISDFYLVFSGIKKGKYGKFYESIDGLKIMDIFMQYSEERMNSYYSGEVNTDSKYKDNEPERKGLNPLSDSIKEIFNR